VTTPDNPKGLHMKSLFEFVKTTVIGGLFTVFVPSAPTPAAGSIYYLTAERLKLLDIPVSAALGFITRLGVGLHRLFDSQPELVAELLNYNPHSNDQSV
jgi:uncharacterized membrane protein